MKIRTRKRSEVERTEIVVEIFDVEVDAAFMTAMETAVLDVWKRLKPDVRLRALYVHRGVRKW